VAAALSTRLGVSKTTVAQELKGIVTRIEQWGRVQRTDSEGGDIIRASEVGNQREDGRDATFARVGRLLFVSAR
jgi:hypothetical protein